MTIRKIINTTYDHIQMWAKSGTSTMIKVFGVTKDGVLELAPLASEPANPTGSNLNLYNYGGAIRIQNAVNGARTPQFGGKSIINTTTGTVVATSGNFYTNTTAVGPVIVNLPVPGVSGGDEVGIAVTTDNQFVRIQLTNGCVILNGSASTVTSNGTTTGYFRNAAIGSMINLISVNSTTWIVSAISGVWLVDE